MILIARDDDQEYEPMPEPDNGWMRYLLSGGKPEYAPNDPPMIPIYTPRPVPIAYDPGNPYEVRLIVTTRR